MLKYFKRKIQLHSGIKQILDNQVKIISSIDKMMKQNDEILKAQIFNSTIINSEWLKYKNFSPGNWAVDYSFLYTLYRVLTDMRPSAIIEFGLGESSKVIHQYANHFKKEATTYEHDINWRNFFLQNNQEYFMNIQMVELSKTVINSYETLTYRDIEETMQNRVFDLIVIDGPFGSKNFSRPQILPLLPSCLNKTFCIILDDFNRSGEKETYNEITKILDKCDIPCERQVYGGVKEHAIICSSDLKYLTTL